MQLIRHDLLKLNCIDIQDYNLDYWISKIVKIVSTFFICDYYHYYDSSLMIFRLFQSYLASQAETMSFVKKVENNFFALDRNNNET